MMHCLGTKDIGKLMIFNVTKISDITMTNEEICLLPKDTGNQIILNETRWYHNTSAGVCEEMVYSGGGNLNNFETEAHCTKFCGGLKFSGMTF